MTIKRYDLDVVLNSDGFWEACPEGHTEGRWVCFEDHRKELLERVKDAYEKGIVDGRFDEQLRRK